MRYRMQSFVAGLIFLGATVAQAALSPGAYEIHGVHSVLGTYFGKLLIQPDLSAQRMAEFRPASPQQVQALGLPASAPEAVQQLWQGQLTEQGLRFEVRTSHTMTGFNGFRLPKEAFAVQTVVIPEESAAFALAGEGTYTESYVRLPDAPGSSQSLFAPEQRTLADAFGRASSPLVQIARAVGIDKAIEMYRALPFFEPYRSRREFQQNEMWQYKDFTDLEFYRATRGVLRVRNLSLTPLSIGEAFQRRMAFGPSLAEKEAYKYGQTLSLLNELNILEVGIRDEQGRIVQRRPEGDAALWHAMFIWALHLRYQQTGNRADYDVLRNAITGTMHLIRVSQVSNEPQLFARYIYKSPASQPTSDPNEVQGTGPYSEYKYNRRSNNDMTKGILLGFTVAWMGLSPNDPLRQEISQMIPRLRGIEAIRSENINLADAEALDALWNGNPAALEAFLKAYEDPKHVAGDWFNAASGFHWGGIQDSSGIHLTTVSNSIQFLLAQQLQVKLGRSDRLARVQAMAEGNLKLMMERMRNSHRGFIPVVAYALTGDQALRAEAAEGARNLIEIPIEAAAGEVESDLSYQPDWSYSSWPHRPWKAIKGFRKIDADKIAEPGQRLSAYGYPIYEGVGWSTSYLWKESYQQMLNPGTPRVLYFSADYLWAYWLARTSGLISARD